MADDGTLVYRLGRAEESRVWSDRSTGGRSEGWSGGPFPKVFWLCAFVGGGAVVVFGFT